MGKVIIEGIGACFIILLVCVIGIANGAVGLVHLYKKDVRDWRKGCTGIHEISSIGRLYRS